MYFWIGHYVDFTQLQEKLSEKPDRGQYECCITKNMCSSQLIYSSQCFVLEMLYLEIDFLTGKDHWKLMCTL